MGPSRSPGSACRPPADQEVDEEILWDLEDDPTYWILWIIYRRDPRHHQ